MVKIRDISSQAAQQVLRAIHRLPKFHPTSYLVMAFLVD